MRVLLNELDVLVVLGFGALLVVRCSCLGFVGLWCFVVWGGLVFKGEVFRVSGSVTFQRFKMSTLGHSDFVRAFRILGLWASATLGLWGFGTLGLWDFVNLRRWTSGLLNHRKPQCILTTENAAYFLTTHNAKALVGQPTAPKLTTKNTDGC